MNKFVGAGARIVVLACFFVCGPAGAQPGIVDRVGSSFETLRELLNVFGEKTEDVVGPGRIEPPPGLQPVNLEGLVTETRDLPQQFAASRFHTLSISSRFGAVQIQPWENQIISVVAHISASAQTKETAAALVQQIAPNINPSERLLEISTFYPDSRGLGEINMQVNYEINVPRETSVVCKAEFADVEVAGVGGAVSIDSLLGAVTLDRLESPVTLRARGEYPVTATGLAQGGVFIMRGALAKFEDIGGDLRIDNSDGIVELRRLRDSIVGDVVNANGPIHVYLPENHTVDVEAVVLFGGEMQSEVIQSQFPLVYHRRGILTSAALPHPDSAQKLSLQARFATIHIEKDGDTPSEDTRFEGGFYISNPAIAPMTAPCPEGFELVVDAMPGDVTIRGADVQEVVVSGTRIIRLEREEDEERANAALDLRLETVDNRLEVRSDMLQNLQALGAVSATLNLDIQYPRTIPIRIRADRGDTEIEGSGASVTVVQTEGLVKVQHAKGPLDVTTNKGDITVSECEGPAILKASYGTINVFNVFGRLETQGFKGTTIIEAAQGEVVSRSQGGDVKIIAAELIGGNYDIATEEGNISIILSPSANATIFATAKKGVTYNFSGVPFSGTKMRDVENFSGTLNDGLHNLKLNAISGDIIVTQEQ